MIKRVDLLENALDDVHKKCDIVIARLDAIRVKLPSNYAEQNLKDNPSWIRDNHKNFYFYNNLLSAYCFFFQYNLFNYKNTKSLININK